MLIRSLIRTAVIFMVCLSTFSLASAQSDKVKIETNMGDMIVELYPEEAPSSVDNFKKYINDGFYEGTIFHRIIDGFMIQGGGYTADYAKKDTQAPVENEANNGLNNDKYTVAMARTSAPHSATSQFFINTAGNDFLNHTGMDMRGWGYTVFARVIEGREVVDKIGTSATGSGGPFPRDVPIEAVIINRISFVLPDTSVPTPSQSQAETPEKKAKQ